VLYLSGWDMADPLRVGYTYLLFSLNGIAVGVVLLLTSLVDERADARRRDVDEVPPLPSRSP
jgi:hypothetical protein